MAVMFSSIACFFELLCVILYAFVFPKLPIVKFYRTKAASEGSLTVTADLAAGGIKSQPENPLVCNSSKQSCSGWKEMIPFWTCAMNLSGWRRPGFRRTIKQQTAAKSEHGLRSGRVHDLCPHTVNLPGLSGWRHRDTQLGFLVLVTDLLISEKIQ